MWWLAGGHGRHLPSTQIPHFINRKGFCPPVGLKTTTRATGDVCFYLNCHFAVHVDWTYSLTLLSGRLFHPSGLTNSAPFSPSFGLPPTNSTRCIYTQRVDANVEGFAGRFEYPTPRHIFRRAWRCSAIARRPHSGITWMDVRYSPGVQRRRLRRRIVCHDWLILWHDVFVYVKVNLRQPLVHYAEDSKLA